MGCTVEGVELQLAPEFIRSLSIPLLRPQDLALDQACANQVRHHFQRRVNLSQSRFIDAIHRQFFRP